MRFLFLSLIILFSTSETEKTFPVLQGETLSGKQISLPSDTKGKYTLIGAAYSQKADDALKGWMQPVYSTFIEPPSSSLFPSEPYDVNLYFVPMISGIAKTAGGKIKQEMKEKIDKKLHNYILVYEGEIKTYKASLEMPDKDQPYFFVLDKNGKIVKTFSGAYSEDKLDEVLEIIEEE